jgi:hypothetical protein
MARIFISYRSADGADKATALARDLGARFGDEQVFLDKDDLRGGVAWRDEVTRAIGQRPVLLLLVTPQLLAATGPDARPRIADADDPVRREVQAALDAGATLVPVLCDGVDALPAAGTLPPPFDRLAELTWRRLRAYDWASDVQRLVADLQATGVPLRAAAASRPPQRRAVLFGTTLAAVAGGAGLASWWRRRGSDAPAPDVAAMPGAGPGPASAPATADPLQGDWLARFGEIEEMRLTLSPQGERITLASAPVPITERADWADYRRFWLERTGAPLEAIAYRGEGLVRRLPETAPVIDIALQVLALPGGEVIDGGNLSAALQPDGRLLGRRWLNSTQAETPAVLERP